MGRLSAPPIALALAVAAVLGLAACGGEDAELLPGDTASEINSNLDLVRQLADEGDCAGAADAAATVSSQVESLGGVDAELKRALSEGTARLNEVITSCDEEAEPEEEEPVIEEAEEPEAEEPDKDQRKEEKEAEKEAKEAETEPTLPPQAEGKAKGHEKQEETTPPSESGGTPSGGIEPSEAVEGDDEESDG